MSEQKLPERFETLEPYLGWALTTEKERTEKRLTCSMEELNAYYNVMLPRLEDVIHYIDENPFDALSEDRRLLINMALSVVEMCCLVERYKRLDRVVAMDPSRFVSIE